MKLLHGDCLKIMEDLVENGTRYDVCITDPPFGLKGEESFTIVRHALDLMKRVSNTQILILDWRNPLTVDDGKFAELVWEYGWISGGRTKSNHFYPTHNTIHFLGKDTISFDTKNGSIIKRQPGFSSPRQTSFAKKTGHPYEKPIKLMEYLVRISGGKTVIDPFMGSGTTGVACNSLGVRFTGIEKDEKYYKIAESRILSHVTK